MPQSTFHNSFSPLLTSKSYKGLGMSRSTPTPSQLQQATSAQEAKSNSARVSPQPNHNKRAGTPAWSTTTPVRILIYNNSLAPRLTRASKAAKQLTAASGRGHKNGKSHGNGSNRQPSASPNATRPAPPGKGKASQGAATSDNMQTSASPNATRPAPPAKGKGKATQGAATSGKGPGNVSNMQPTASPNATPPVSRTKRKGRKAKHPVAAGPSGVTGSGKGSNDQVAGEVTVASDETVEGWWPSRKFISPLNGDNDLYPERMDKWEQLPRAWEPEDRAQAIAYLYEIRPEWLSLFNDYVEQERGLWKAP
ncbi:hypothetical protein D9611_005308 [Ephemerocybe angulata]|uniref:Uncharacterized protein n=1 Tax=Ephemerocybe angulata TaxID=980116 RepID=A0A8H5C236_9AGAR|nr:hypothetical protein D9611_005308 [Tulosesus angulatus]